MGMLKAWWRRTELRTPQTKKDRVTEVTDMLRQIPTGKMLMDVADEKGIIVRFVDGLECVAKYRPSKIIEINSKCLTSLQAVVLAHELRHVWQDKEGLSLRRQTHVRDNIINHRFTEADAFAIEAQIAWELSAHGVDRNAWPTYKRQHRGLASVFEAEARRSKGALNGKSLRATFDHWFRTSYRSDYDRDSVDDSRKQLRRAAEGRRATVETDKKRGPDEPERMSAGFLREFGRVAGGINYLEDAATLSADYAGIYGTIKRQAERLERKYDLATVKIK